MSSNDQRLLIREWISVALVGGVMLTLGAISWLSDRVGEGRVQEAHITEAPLLTFEVKGAVSHPGTYQFPPGTSVGDVLKAAKLLKSADRKKIPLKKVLYSSQVLLVPAKLSHDRKQK